MTSGIPIYQEERPWGNFRQFTQNNPSTVKIITVKPGESLSLQSHEHRTEFWRVIKGQGVVEIDEAKHLAKEGDEFTVQAGSKHRVSVDSESPSDFIFLEIAFGEFDEQDIKRYEDKYGRGTQTI